MVSKLRSKKWLLLISLFLGFILVLVVIFVFMIQNRNQHRAENAPPTVIISAPTPEEALIPSPSLTVDAVAFGDTPIARVEFWMDGVLSGTLTSETPEGVPSFEVSFSASMAEGSHMFFVRAVDIAGIIGQSMPVLAEGTLQIAGDGPHFLIEVGPSDTLEDIAAEYGVDTQTLQQSNPGLGSSGLKNGSTLNVPIPNPGGSQGGSGGSTGGGSGPVNIPNTPMLNPVNDLMIDIRSLLPFVFSPPLVPGNLQAEIKDCNITLRWDDNSINEIGYKVWMAGQGLPPRVITTLEAVPGMKSAWYQFQAPRPGSFSFWVEAFNGVGGQPSNIVKTNIDSKCPGFLATHLQIDAVDFNVSGGYDRTYCYISLEGAPEVRLPKTDGVYIQMVNGKGDIAKWASGANKFALPIPGDEALTLEGKCMGWLSGTLVEIGRFKETSVREEWDGRNLTLSGSTFDIGYQVRPLGAMDTVGLFRAEDSSLLRPYDVKDTKIASTQEEGGILKITIIKNKRRVTWKWTGDSKDITGFMISLNGIPYKEVGPNTRSIDLEIPGYCGTHIKWEIVATTDQTQSRPSDPFEYDQDPCTVYFVVDFERVKFFWTNDRLDNGDYGCSRFELYFHIYVEEYVFNDPTPGQKGQKVNEVGKPFGGAGGVTRHVWCKTYTFQQLVPPGYKSNSTKVIYPVEVKPGVHYGLRIGAILWDMDGGGDDVVSDQFFWIYFTDENPKNDFTVDLSKIGRRDWGTTLDCNYPDPAGYKGPLVISGHAYTKQEICVSLYRENPSTGEFLKSVGSAVPGGQPPTKTETDLEITQLTYDLPWHGFNVFIKNNGPKDLVNGQIKLAANLLSDDPKLKTYPATQHELNLKVGESTSLTPPVHYKIDLTKYDYAVQAKYTPINFTDPVSKNDSNDIDLTATSAGSGKLNADLEILDFSVNADEFLLLKIKNNGPDPINNQQLRISCTRKAINRRTGKSEKFSDMEDKHAGVSLASGQTLDWVGPSTNWFIVDAWWEVTCTLDMQNDITDPEQNNKLTKIIHQLSKD
jgi:hypothetical protein